MTEDGRPQPETLRMQGYEGGSAEAARQAGLVWGGDWRSIKDLMHVELRRQGVMPR